MKLTKKVKPSKGFGTNGTVKQHKNDELVSSPPSLPKENTQMIANEDLTTAFVPPDNEKVVHRPSSPYSNVLFPSPTLNLQLSVCLNTSLNLLSKYFFVNAVPRYETTIFTDTFKA